MFELAIEDYSSLTPLLGEVRLGAEIAGAVLAGHTTGSVFVQGRADLRAAFVYVNGFCVFAGADAQEEFARSCVQWLVHHRGQDFFILYPGHEGWVPVLDKIAVAPTKRMPRVAFDFDADAFMAMRSSRPLPAGFELVSMDAGWMQRAAETVYPWIAGTWRNASEFAAQGIGVCAVRGGRIASLCHSVFVSGVHHEIDIYSVEEFRGRGLARAAAAAFVEECLARGLQPGWNCFEDNLPSYRLALALGFKPSVEFPVYVR